MRIIDVSKPSIELRGSNRVRINCQVAGEGLPDILWFEYPAEYSQYLDEENVDWIAASLLLPAMNQDAILRIDGRMSPLLHAAISTDVQHIVAMQNPLLQPVAIEVEPTESNETAKGHAVATGFSAGVDTFATLALSQAHKCKKITHLTVLNVGAMGRGEAAKQLFGRYSDRLQHFCDDQGFEALTVDSNLVEFYTEKVLGFQKNHTIRGVAALLPLIGLIGTYYYSSSFEYSKIGVQPTYDISYADPILLPLLSTELLQFRASGTYLSRLDKVRMVAELKCSYEHLDVCVDEPEGRADRRKPNCSKCWKCGRQLLTLELLGKLETYQGVFDIPKYQQSKFAIIRKLAMDALQGDRPNDLDVLLLAQEKGVLPALSTHHFLRLASQSYRFRKAAASLIARRIANSQI